MATLVANSINARTTITGYSGTASSATVTITAPVGNGAALNGTAIAVVQSGITVNPSGAQHAGGVDASPGSMNLTITALGQKEVQNPNYSGPNATTAPYN